MNGIKYAQFFPPVGCRFEGSFGPLIPNPNPNPKQKQKQKQKQRRREKAYGMVIRAVDQQQWEIVGDINGEIKIITSTALKVVLMNLGFQYMKQ